MIQENAIPATPVQHFVPLPSLPLDQIILGDNCEVMRTLPSESIDLVVTSPPYDDLRTYGGHSWDFETLSSELWRTAKVGGVVVWVVADQTIDGSETGTSFRQALRFMEVGFKLNDTMIYHKKGNAFPRHGHRKYPGAWEYCFVLTKGKPKTWNPLKDVPNTYAGSLISSATVRNEDGTTKPALCNGNKVAEFRCRDNVWMYDTGYMKGQADAVAYKHPATFPEALARDHILSWSDEGDIVLDPFSGSGTTAKMAKHNGRRYIGIEVNPEYVEISKERLTQGVLF